MQNIKKNKSGVIDSHCHLDFKALKDDLPGVLSRAKSEGVSRILRESMLLKTPIIASKISGTIEILRDGCGYLIDGFNEKNFYKAFCDLIDNDFLKKEMVNLAFDRYNKVYSNKAYKKNLQNLLKLIDDKSK